MKGGRGVTKYSKPESITIGKDIIDEFIKAGLVPDNCIRFSLHVPCDNLVRLEYEVYPNGERLKKVALTQILTQNERDDCANKEKD